MSEEEGSGGNSNDGGYVPPVALMTPSSNSKNVDDSVEMTSEDLAKASETMC